jgi:hypothetical protein
MSHEGIFQMTRSIVAMTSTTKKPGRVRRAVGPKKGVVDFYRSKGGRIVSVDALVPQDVAGELIRLRTRRLNVYQSEVGGMVLIDAKVSAPVAAIMSALAKEAGVRVRQNN